MNRLISILTLVTVLLSCVKKEEDPQVVSEREFQNYLHQLKETPKLSQSGLYYLPTDTGTGIKAVKGDYVLVNITGTLLNATVIETNDSLLAEKSNIKSATKFNIPLKVDFASTFFPGLVEGIEMLREGGKAHLILPFKLANGMYATQTIPHYANLVYDVELIKVIKDPVRVDSLLLSSWLRLFNFSDSARVESVYYQQITPGTDSIGTTDSIFYSYTKTTVDGYVVDYRARDTTSLNTMTVPGILAGLQRMTVGEKAKFVIWQKYGYGAEGLSGVRQDFYKQQIIPAYTSFIMDLEIKEARAKK